MAKKFLGLKEDEIKTSVNILETVLATEVVINMKIRNYHWNIEALNFSELHKFFEEMYDDSSEGIDEIAERIRML
jgi:starvation-inducible DNA-binding protein